MRNRILGLVFGIFITIGEQCQAFGTDEIFRGIVNYKLMLINSSRHIKSIKFFPFLLLFSAPAFGQKIVYGVIKSASNNEVIPYANVIITGKQIGTYSDERGRFEINAGPNDSLTISSIGFKRLTILSEDIIKNNYLVVLQPEVTQLQSVTILAKKGKVKFERHTFGYLKTKRRSLISSSVPGVQFATFIQNNLNTEGIIESLFLVSLVTANPE